MKQPERKDMVEIAPGKFANAAGVAWLEKHRQQPKDPHAAIRCERYDWVCPFMQRGEHPPCKYAGHGGKREHGHNLAFIGYEIGIPQREPVGQMSLFEPNKTHRVVWRHWKTGAEVEPYSVHPMDIVCKDRALAALEILRRHSRGNGKKPANWKVLALDNDITWGETQAQRGNLKPCWFQAI